MQHAYEKCIQNFGMEIRREETTRKTYVGGLKWIFKTWGVGCGKAQDKVQWQALVNTQAENLLTRWVTISFWRRPLLRSMWHPGTSTSTCFLSISICFLSSYPPLSPLTANHLSSPPLFAVFTPFAFNSVTVLSLHRVWFYGEEQMPSVRANNPYHGKLLLLLDNRVRVCRFLCFLQVQYVFEAITVQITEEGVHKMRSMKNSVRSPETLKIQCVLRSLTKLKTTVTSRLPAGTAWLTARLYKVFPLRDKYRSTRTIPLTYLYYSSSCREVTVAFNFISERTVSLAIQLILSFFSHI
jgi:hypothetical protein